MADRLTVEMIEMYRRQPALHPELLHAICDAAAAQSPETEGGEAVAKPYAWAYDDGSKLGPVLHLMKMEDDTGRFKEIPLFAHPPSREGWPTEDMVAAGAQELFESEALTGTRLSIDAWKGTARAIIEAAIAAAPQPGEG